MTNTSINYSLYTKADADDMSRLLGDVFAHRDPPAVAVGLSAAEFEAFVRLYVDKADAEGLTVVARLASTGDMIGALLAEDSGSAPPEGFDRLSTKFNPIFDILASSTRSIRAASRGSRANRFISSCWASHRASGAVGSRNAWSPNAWHTADARATEWR